MKTLRLIGTTLLMVMLAVNFTACSDDEDEQTIIEHPVYEGADWRLYQYNYQ